MNRADKRKYHVIYKTTCLVTGKWYIGMHSTDDLADGYLGSGQRLWKSIKKYGKDQHVYDILECLPDRKSLVLREEQLLTMELRSDPLCMNLRNGGTGNYPGTPSAAETKAKISTSLKAFYSSDDGRKLISSRSYDHTKRGEHHGMFGKTHTAAVRERIRVANSRPKGPFSEEHKRRLSDAAKARHARNRIT